MARDIESKRRKIKRHKLKNETNNQKIKDITKNEE